MFACGLSGLLPVDYAVMLLVECADFRHVTRFARRRGRFAPAELASRACDHAVTL